MLKMILYMSIGGALALTFGPPEILSQLRNDFSMTFGEVYTCARENVDLSKVEAKLSQWH